MNECVRLSMLQVSKCYIDCRRRRFVVGVSVGGTATRYSFIHKYHILVVVVAAAVIDKIVLGSGLLASTHPLSKLEHTRIERTGETESECKRVSIDVKVVRMQKSNPSKLKAVGAKKNTLTHKREEKSSSMMMMTMTTNCCNCYD